METAAKNILIGISGGIAAYKSCILVRELIKRKYAVRVIMTRNAERFVTPLTFESLANNRVYTGMFVKEQNMEIVHIEIGRWSDLMIIAPATANLIGKISAGIADDLLSTTVMALPSGTPVLFAPAMNTNMWENPVVQRNIGFLREIGAGRKYRFIEPAEKLLACGDTGKGAMASIKTIVCAIEESIQNKNGGK